jgi:SNF2 family DNA or RNA helicase
MQPNSNLNTKPTTSVDFDEKRGRFLIRCPVWDNNRVRALPNRRWDGKAKHWTAPAIRANVECLNRLFMASAEISEAARNKIDGYTAERKGRVRPSAFPSFYGFKRSPRQKQREALEKTYGLHAFALFMDMRTGKTKVLIDMACALRIEDKVNRVVLVCPLSLRKNWTREFAKDATIPVDYHLLDTKDKGKSFDRWLNTPHDFKWLIVGVESLAAGSAIEYVKRFCLTSTKILCAVDESSKIKTHSAARSKNVVSLRNSCEYRGILSGTPMTKSPLDLFMQYEFIDPDIIGLGDYYAFRARYAVMGGYENRQVIGYENLDELIELISPYTYQVRQSEVFESAKEYVVREVELSPKQRASYADLKKYSRLDGDDGKVLVVQNVLEKMLRLQEVTGGFVSYEYSDEQIESMRKTWGESKKLPRTYRVPVDGENPKVAEILACAEDYEGPTIVWCAFKDEIYAVCKALRDVYGDDQVVEYHGDVDEDQRDQHVQAFLARKARFFVGNAATGGMGLTLDIADNIFYFSNTFNYVDREQSEERGTAEGKTMLIVDIVARGTVDDTILEANEAKKDVSEYVRGKIDEQRAAMGAQAAIDALLGG